MNNGSKLALGIGTIAAGIFVAVMALFSLASPQTRQGSVFIIFIVFISIAGGLVFAAFRLLQEGLGRAGQAQVQTPPSKSKFIHLVIYSIIILAVLLFLPMVFSALNQLRR